MEALVFLAAVRMEADAAVATRLLAAVRTIDREKDASWIPDTRAASSRPWSSLRASASDSGSRLSGRRGHASRWKEETVALALDKE